MTYIPAMQSPPLGRNILTEGFLLKDVQLLVILHHGAMAMRRRCALPKITWCQMPWLRLAFCIDLSAAFQKQVKLGLKGLPVFQFEGCLLAIVNSAPEHAHVTKERPTLAACFRVLASAQHASFKADTL